MKKTVIYCRVSTSDQDCTRQKRDLQAFAERAGYEILAIFTETASGMKDDRSQRAKIMKLAQARKIDTVLVTEMTRWGRSTIDLLTTLKMLNCFDVSIIATTGFQFDLSNPQGKLIAGFISLLSEFERDLIAERTKSGLAAARARGQRLGRPRGSRSVLKHQKQVKTFLAEGKTYRWIADELHIGKDTVMAIAKTTDH